MHRKYLMHVVPTNYRQDLFTLSDAQYAEQSQQEHRIGRLMDGHLLDPVEPTGKIRSDTWLVVHLSVVIVRYGIADGKNTDW